MNNEKKNILNEYEQYLRQGEQWELRNRYMLIGAEETTPNKHRTSTEQVPNKFDEPSSSVAALIKAIGRQQLKGTEAMAAIGLKHRPTFLANYLAPAIGGGFVTMLYPNSPRHPRQRYLLTPKGLMYFNANNNEDNQ